MTIFLSDTAFAISSVEPLRRLRPVPSGTPLYIGNWVPFYTQLNLPGPLGNAKEKEKEPEIRPIASKLSRLETLDPESSGNHALCLEGSRIH